MTYDFSISGVSVMSPDTYEVISEGREIFEAEGLEEGHAYFLIPGMEFGVFRIAKIGQFLDWLNGGDKVYGPRHPTRTTPESGDSAAVAARIRESFPSSGTIH
jgi:hypothetical protein